MQRFERVVALPEPKDIELMSRTTASEPHFQVQYVRSSER